MSRGTAIAIALVMLAVAARAEDDRSDYAKAAERLTERLNTTISESVELKEPAPPAKRKEAPDEAAPPRQANS
jgi:hypothetical protein